MEIIQRPEELQERIRDLRKTAEQAVGLVPTMGALHEGHVSLIRRARSDCSLVVLSIFVNPTQFGMGEDYLTYPRNIDEDIKVAIKNGVDIVFAPLPAAMYPHGYQSFIDVEKLSHGLCGASRPGHFRGVATVVCKLFNLVKPDYAYFGQKDYQQVQVVKQMVRDLNMDAQVVMLPIMREQDGLAISSRNIYLKGGQRESATVLYRALKDAERLISSGELNAGKIRRSMQQIIEQEPGIQVDYIAICHRETLEPLEEVTPGAALIALAAKLGKTRLIDNLLI